MNIEPFLISTFPFAPIKLFFSSLKKFSADIYKLSSLANILNILKSINKKKSLNFRSINYFSFTYNMIEVASIRGIAAGIKDDKNNGILPEIASAPIILVK